MSDLLCPKCDGVTVEHTLSKAADLLAENDRLRARIAFWRREYAAFDGRLSGETLTEMEVAGRAELIKLPQTQATTEPSTGAERR